MKRLTRVMVILSVLAAMMAVFGGAAYAFPGGTWVSGVTVANLSSELATVNIKFYKQDGSTALDFDAGTIAANKAKTWYLPTQVSGLPDPFIGSAVVSSDKEIAAIVNTQFPSGSDPMRVGTSTGVGTPTETVYATQLMKNYGGWNSYCAVQNTGSTEATGVQVTYYDADGNVEDTDTQNIAAYASYIFDQSDDSELADGMYSAKFVGDSSHPLAVVCNFYNSGAAADSSQFHSYNGLGAGGTTLYIPRVVKDYYDYQSGLKIQNVGSEALDVTVTYTFGGTDYTQTSPSIGPGQSWGPYMGSEAQLPSSMAGVSQVSGSAIVAINSPNANKQIIATINEDNRVDPAGRGVTYEAALESDATASLVFPQVTSEYYGYCSGVQVQKVSSGTASCTASFSAMGSISAFDETFSLTDSDPSWDIFAPNGSGMVAGVENDNYNGSVTVSCPGAEVIGISNLSFRYDRDTRYGDVAGDTFTTARGINK